MSHRNWKLKLDPRNRRQSAAQHRQAAVARHTGLVNKSLQNLGCTTPPPSFIEMVRKHGPTTLTVGDMRREHDKLILVKRAKNQGISADDARNLVEAAAQHSVSGDAPKELTILRAANLMRCQRLKASQAWEQASAADLKPQATLPATPPASDKKGAPSASPKALMTAALVASKSGALARTQALPSSARARDLAQSRTIVIHPTLAEALDLLKASTSEPKVVRTIGRTRILALSDQVYARGKRTPTAAQLQPVLQALANSRTDPKNDAAVKADVVAAMDKFAPLGHPAPTRPTRPSRPATDRI